MKVQLFVAQLTNAWSGRIKSRRICDASSADERAERQRVRVREGARSSQCYRVFWRAPTRTGCAALESFVGRRARPRHVWGQIVEASEAGLLRRALANEIYREAGVLCPCPLAHGAEPDEEKQSRKHQLEIPTRVPRRVIPRARSRQLSSMRVDEFD